MAFDSQKPVLSISNLSVAFGGRPSTKRKFPNFLKKVVENCPSVQVTDRVSFEIYPGEFFALVGESGCGKSVTAMSILRLLPWPSAKIVDGSVIFDGNAAYGNPADACFDNPAAASSDNPADAVEGNPAGSVDLAKISLEEMQKIRGSEIACIFQEPMQALNPVMTIKKQLLEVFKFGAAKIAVRASNSADSSNENHAKEPLEIIREQLLAAGFKDPDRVLNSYPHELSGGMLQRVCIVMALLPCPKLIIADEPTTALDVTVQAQVLKVLKEMAENTGTAVLLITHNMGIVSEYAHRVAVMYAGRIVECGPVRDVINNPLHPYTRGLLAAIPESHSDMKHLKSIPGTVPHPKDFAKGCRFADRCENCSRSSKEIQAKCRSMELPPKVFAPADKDCAKHYACCFDLD